MTTASVTTTTSSIITAKVPNALALSLGYFGNAEGTGSPPATLTGSCKLNRVIFDFERFSRWLKGPALSKFW
jgi:hypothetical protein